MEDLKRTIAQRRRELAAVVALEEAEKQAAAREERERPSRGADYGVLSGGPPAVGRATYQGTRGARDRERTSDQDRARRKRSRSPLNKDSGKMWPAPAPPTRFEPKPRKMGAEQAPAPVAKKSTGGRGPGPFVYDPIAASGGAGQRGGGYHQQPSTWKADVWNPNPNNSRGPGGPYQQAGPASYNAYNHAPPRAPTASSFSRPDPYFALNRAQPAPPAPQRGYGPAAPGPPSFRRT